MRALMHILQRTQSKNKYPQDLRKEQEEKKAEKNNEDKNRNQGDKNEKHSNKIINKVKTCFSKV